MATLCEAGGCYACRGLSAGIFAAAAAFGLVGNFRADGR
jgi:hypothetical protein